MERNEPLTPELFFIVLVFLILSASHFLQSSEDQDLTDDQASMAEERSRNTSLMGMGLVSVTSISRKMLERPQIFNDFTEFYGCVKGYINSKDWEGFHMEKD